MLNKNVSFLNLLGLVKGLENWAALEPETILFELGSAEPLLLEKLYALQQLAKKPQVVSLPEFLLWFTSLANNEPAEFETIALPTGLELSWSVFQLKQVLPQLGDIFKPSEELIETVAYLLTEQGFSEPIPPFEFVPRSLLTSGQLPEDTEMKKKAIDMYLKYMTETCHV